MILPHTPSLIDQVISDFDEMKALIARLHLSIEEGEDDDNEAFINRSGLVCCTVSFECIACYLSF